jgi:hypothetical protein
MRIEDTGQSQAAPRQHVLPYLKQTQAKRARSIAQVETMSIKQVREITGTIFPQSWKAQSSQPQPPSWQIRA